MLAGVWARLRDRLSAVNSSFFMVPVTKDYAARFYDMYVNRHEGKHLIADRVRILLLLLPFRDLMAPEVSECILCYVTAYIACYLSHVSCLSQEAFMNNKIRVAVQG